MACSDEEEDPQQAFCSDLEEFQTDLRAVVDAIGSLNRSEIEDAIDEARTSAAELRSSGQELRAGEAEQIESAFNDLRESVEAVGQGGGLQANLRTVQTSAQALGTAVANAASKYQCE